MVYTSMSRSELETGEEDKPERKRLLALRSKVDEKKPDFVRPESWRYNRLDPRWRRPRGLDNKVRRQIKGWPTSPRMGYRTPKAVRHLHPSGLEEVLISNLADLSLVNPQRQAVRIGGKVGGRKRNLIVTEAAKMGVRVLNPGGERMKVEPEK